MQRRTKQDKLNTRPHSIQLNIVCRCTINKWWEVVVWAITWCKCNRFSSSSKWWCREINIKIWSSNGIWVIKWIKEDNSRGQECLCNSKWCVQKCKAKTWWLQACLLHQWWLSNRTSNRCSRGNSSNSKWCARDRCRCKVSRWGCSQGCSQGWGQVCQWEWVKECAKECRPLRQLLPLINSLEDEQKKLLLT